MIRNFFSSFIVVRKELFSFRNESLYSILFLFEEMEKERKKKELFIYIYNEWIGNCVIFFRIMKFLFENSLTILF